jgi:hypothetical protein
MKLTSSRGTDRRPKSTKNLDGYGAPEIPWSKVRGVLDAGFTQAPTSGGPDRHTCWLSTVNANGSPHTVPLGSLWLGGVFYFTSGDGARKSKNLAKEPRCSIAVATRPFDLVLEGEAKKVKDKATLERVAKAFRAQGWKAAVKGGALTAEYSAPSAGPPPWYVYEMVPKTVFAFGTAEPYGAARWDF